LQHAGERCRGVAELALEVPPRRAVADHGESGTRHLAQDGLEALDPFLGSQTSYVEKEPVLRVSAGEPLAPLHRGFARVEAAGVHPLRPEAYPLHSLLEEVAHRGLGGA
jgi:hypothetical protein